MSIKNVDRGLTRRQQREIDHYVDRDQRDQIASIDFEQFERAKPGNPYWRVFNLVTQQRRDGTLNLLSYGCGRGVNAVRYAMLGFNVYGFDLVPRHIENAEFLAAKYDCKKRVQFSVQAAESMEYPASFFDVVVGEDILHHVELEPALAGVHRVLKPGGVAIFKDSLQTPRRDRIRNHRFVTRWIPKGTKSIPKRLSYHGTPDERVLNDDDLVRIRQWFPNLQVERFRVLAILSVLVANKRFLERADWLLFSVFPWIRRYGDHVVLVMRKQA